MAGFLDRDGGARGDWGGVKIHSSAGQRSPDLNAEVEDHEEELEDPEGYEDAFQPWGFAGGSLGG